MNEIIANERNHNLFYENLPVRIILDENGAPWFVAKDVCEVLDISNVADAVGKLDEDEKLVSVLPISGQNREVWTINESGLYTLIIRSNKPEAKPFRRWVTHEVLPSIRKTGGYIHPSACQNDLVVMVNSLIDARIEDILESLHKAVEARLTEIVGAKLDKLTEAIDAQRVKYNQVMINSNVYGPVWSFAHRCCNAGQSYVIGKDTLYDGYVRYCRLINVHIEARGPFFARLYHAVQSCYNSTLTRGGLRQRVVRGIRLDENKMEAFKKENAQARLS